MNALERWKKLLPFRSSVGGFQRLMEYESALQDITAKISALNAQPPYGTSPTAEERFKALKRAYEFKRNRLRTIEDIRKRAGSDKNLSVIGGITNSGAFAGSGGGDAPRPVSFQFRQ